MMNLFGFKIGLMRQLLGIKIPNMFSFVVNHYGSSPLFCLFWFCDSKRFSVVSVNYTICKPQIIKSVVSFIAVNVIEHFFWKFPIGKRPSNPMRVKIFPHEMHRKIARFVFCAAWKRRFQVCQNAGTRVVGKFTFEFGKINIVHAVALPCNGLKSDGSMLTHRAVASL